MRGELAAIRAAGGSLVFIGNGTPAMAADFAQSHAAGCSVLTDPSLESYKVMRLQRGVGRTLGPRSAIRGLRAIFNGHHQTRLAGDPWQQGGVFVIDRTGTIVYEQRNEDAGARPDRNAILAALEGLKTKTG